MQLKYRTVLLFVIVMCAMSCTVVRPYETQYLKDTTMEPNTLHIEKLEGEAESFREGASGGTGGKSGGGCGCN